MSVRSIGGWTLAFTALLALFLVWFVDSEKRRHKTSNLVRDLLQNNQSNNVMLGSSSIRNFDSQRYLDCGNWENRGIGTAGIPDILNYLQITPKQWVPEWVMLYAGENDIARDGETAGSTILMYDELIDTLLTKLTNSSLLLLEIKPSPKRANHHSAFDTVNDHLKKIANQHARIEFVASDWNKVVTAKALQVFKDDGVHLNNLGYQIMSKEINQVCNNQ